MRRYDIVSLIPLILTIVTFALAAPVQVQEKRQAPEDVITVLGKRTMDEDFYMVFGNLRFDENGLVNPNPAAVHLQEPAPPPDVPLPNVAGAHVPPPNVAEAHVLPPNVVGVHVPEVHVPQQGPADSDRESIELDGDAPPGSSESGHSDSLPTSPGWSTQSEGWYTAPSSVGSDSDSDRWSTISNAPSEASQSENLKAADEEMRGKAKVSRRISGTASGSKLKKKRGSRGPANPIDF